MDPDRILHMLAGTTALRIPVLALFSLLLAFATPVRSQDTGTLANRFPEPRFEHIGLKDGLPENTVRCILQDRFGFLWLGTQNGLAKYDGYSMVVYRQDPDDPGSISDNDIPSLYEDRAGVLWVGTTFGGLNKFNRGNGTFTRYPANPLDSGSIGFSHVSCIHEDSSDRLWVAYGDGGLCLLDRKTGTFTRYYLQEKSYGPEVYAYLSGLQKRGHQLGSIAMVGDNANITTRFTLNQKATVLLVVMGEGVADYGWLENERGQIVAQYNSRTSLHAGGRPDNRIHISLMPLDAGRYRIRYRSDDIHSYGRWSGEAPTHPEFWGIRVFDVSGEVENARRTLDAHQPVNLPTRVNAVIEDKQTGNLFVGINRPGLWTFDASRKVFSQHNLPIDDHVLAAGYIRTFHRARDGTLWIGSTFGLSRYDPRTNTIKSYQVLPSMTYVPENNFGAVFEDPAGLVWVGNYARPALEAFDPRTGRFRHYGNDPNDPFSLAAGLGVFSVYGDRSGVLWIGTFGGGLDKWGQRKRRFQTIEADPGYLPMNFERSIHEDHAGRILVGTDEGLVQLTGDRTRSPNYPFSHRGGHARNLITEIIEDPTDRGVLWISSEDSGLVRFDSGKGLSTRYHHDPRDTNSLSANAVTALLVDHEGVLWVGTRAGLDRFDRATGRFRRFRHDPKDPASIRQNKIKRIYEDRSGILWVSTRVELFGDIGGVHRFDRATGRFTLYRSLVAGRPFAAVTDMHEDQQGNLWVGDFLSGLHMLERTTGRSVHHYTEKDGLASNSVDRMLEDDSGHLWIGTLNGLSRFDLRTRTFKNFWVEDGLPDNSLYGRSLKTRDGRLMFGGPKGLIVFHPDSIKDDPVPPQVVISNVSLFNRPDEKLAVNGYIPELKVMDLSYSQNDLRFDFVGLQFSEPTRNRYEFILENFDRAWVDAGTQRNATYTNLDPGEYTFKVRAANRDGVWNEEPASIRIVITAPWWRTLWAYGLYAISLLGILVVVRRYEINRLTWKHRSELETEEAVRLRSVDEMKSRFFANISHEFRTPLTLILGPVEELQSAVSDEKSRQKLSMMQRNAQRLLRLINQLLDLSRLESGAMKLRASPGNIVTFVKGVTSSFESSARMKHIGLTTRADADDIEAHFDADKLEKILTNLLSNALKFTPEGGTVTLSVRAAGKDEAAPPWKEATTGFVTITVADTGVGIPTEELPRVFDRFYQVDSSQTREHEGSGIGLALTKELVVLHRGDISVKSGVGRGAEFTVRLPLGRNHLKDDEIVEPEERQGPTPGVDELRRARQAVTPAAGRALPHPDEAALSPEDVSSKAALPMLLVVEDNADVRVYIRECLAGGYDVREAYDGAEGIEKAKETIPDLIISDVMMPKKDGYELCRALKLDEKTSHIPIILLTAKAGSENKIEGLETGADDYLTKPFDRKELLARVKNLIELRRKLRERFSVGQVLKPGDVAVTSLDDAFLQKAMAMVEARMGDEKFGVEELYTGLAMSRTQLHRKLTALTGQSAGDFIRYMRLQRGKELLLKNAGTVSEVAFQVGFNSVAYFTKCFREQFGVVPSEVRGKKT